MWPDSHKAFLNTALPRFQEDRRILGIAACGSLTNGEMDEFSDLDLIVVADPMHYFPLFKDRQRLAEHLGHFLVGFTGEHAGEPSLYICLYEQPLLHVDMKFVSLDDFPLRHEEPEVLWERDSALTKSLKDSKPHPTIPDLQWMEDRFWIWLHYGAMRIGRGEIFETIDLLSLIRSRVLGPLILWKNDKSTRGVRRIEKYGGENLSALRATVPLYDARSCEISLKEAARLYVDLRETHAPPDLVRHRRAEMAAMQYLHKVNDKIGQCAEE